MKDCVASALAQSYRNIEVLVSDNASTDDTLAVLESIDDKQAARTKQPGKYWESKTSPSAFGKRGAIISSLFPTTIFLTRCFWKNALVS